MKNKNRLLPILGTALAVLSLAVNAQAIVDSASFSVGYGVFAFDQWGTNETASANTPTTAPNPDGTGFTVGDFTFSVTLTGSAPASNGPGFPNRVLGSSGVAVGSSSDMTVQISASYNGPHPVGGEVAQGFQLNIDQISIYALKHPAWTGTTNEIWWTETTADHNGVSPSTFTLIDGGYTDASNYTKLSWNPADWVLNGTSLTRTFRLPNGTDLVYADFMVDGLEIIGSGSFIYTIPESSSVAMILAGAIFIRHLRNRS